MIRVSEINFLFTESKKKAGLMGWTGVKKCLRRSLLIEFRGEFEIREAEITSEEERRGLIVLKLVTTVGGATCSFLFSLVFHLWFEVAMKFK